MTSPQWPGKFGCFARCTISLLTLALVYPCDTRRCTMILLPIRTRGRSPDNCRIVVIPAFKRFALWFSANELFVGRHHGAVGLFSPVLKPDEPTCNMCAKVAQGTPYQGLTTLNHSLRLNDSKSDPRVASHGVSLCPSDKTRVMYHHTEDPSIYPKFIPHSVNHSVL